MTEKKMRSIQVTTEDAYIDAELVRKELHVHQQSAITIDLDDSYMVSSLEQQIDVKPQEALLVELQAFISRCNGGQSAVPDVDAGVESLRICELVLERIENA